MLEFLHWWNIPFRMKHEVCSSRKFKTVTPVAVQMFALCPCLPLYFVHSYDNIRARDMFI
jgi:hypothetical protein